MVSTVGTESNPKSSGARLENALGHDQNGLATKARFESSDAHNEELGWGIVRLYRDSDETPGLYDDIAPSKGAKGHKTSRRSDGQTESTSFKDEECTTLCILAVPSYLTPSDFLGFVGEKTREDVSHFRMIRTERINRYMVLMKFRNGKRARQWQKEWDGKAFNDMEVSNLHSMDPRPLLTPY
jgi:BRCA1-associated protein